MMLTTEQELARLYYVQNWHPKLVDRLKASFTSANTSLEDQLIRVRAIAESEILSVLRDGDQALDLFVAQAFGFDSTNDMDQFKNQLEVEENHSSPNSGMRNK